MNLDAIRTFLLIAEAGSFSLAAGRLKLTQSTVSSRIHVLEAQLGCELFRRGRGGAELTPAGQDFHGHADQMLRLWEQACDQITLHSTFSASFRFGGPVSLHSRFHLAWVHWMKDNAPDILLHLEAGSSDALLSRLTARRLDAAMMYLPRQGAGWAVEKLLVEKMVLVQHREIAGAWHENFIAVDWGHEFREEFRAAFTQPLAPMMSVGLGSLGLEYVQSLKGAAYLPVSLVADQLAQGTLARVPGTPLFTRPVFLVYPLQHRQPELLTLAISGMREVAASFDRQDQDRKIPCTTTS